MTQLLGAVPHALPHTPSSPGSHLNRVLQIEPDLQGGSFLHLENGITVPPLCYFDGDKQH